MRARFLPPEEWSRVEGTETPALLPYVAPQNVTVLAVEDEEGRIVASLCAHQVTYLEGLHVVPEAKGNAGVMRALLRLIAGLAEARGEQWVLAGADGSGRGERMAGYLRRLGGQELPIRTFMVKTGA
jgi:hypothetical protein